MDVNTLKVDFTLGLGEDFDSPARIKDRFRQIEKIGFDGVSVAEIAHDCFLPMTLGADVTETLQIRSSIAVALARNPMSMAYLAHDLNAYSCGRFTLGLGSQIKAHVMRRFNMPWHRPAAQMRDYIQALNAIWDNFYDNKPLSYEGEYYSHTLMIPDVKPSNVQYGRPQVLLAAVGPLMIQTAAEQANGLIVHSFSTEKYIREVIRPHVDNTLRAKGRLKENFEVSLSPFVVTGENDEEYERNLQVVKHRIAFYASTPAYKPVLDCHGWGDLQPELKALTKQDAWHKMPELISDEVLDAFAVTGTPTEAAQKLKTRYENLLDRIALDCRLSDAVLKAQIEILKEHAADKRSKSS